MTRRIEVRAEAQSSQRGELFFEPVHQAGDPVANELGAKVDEEPESHVRQPQIGQHLFLVDAFGDLDGFDLDNDLLLDDEVRSETLVKLDVLVAHWN